MKRNSKGEFHFPKDGVGLTYAAGERIGDGVKIKVLFVGPTGRSLTLNGLPMTEIGHCEYKAEYVINDKKTTLTVVDTQSGEENSIDVFFFKKAYKKYRFTLDDNIWCFQNLTENKDKYESMFEDPYLGLLKSIHDKYGSKFHLNIYYETPRHGGFNLSQMTDKFKEEFKANSDWLRLSFHANADKPNRPYICASYEQAYFEMERVNKEILRFAGEEAFAKTAMSIHWGDCSVETAKAFRDLGIRALIDEFNQNTDNNTDLRLYCDAEQCALLKKYGILYDKELDLFLYRYNSGIQRRDPETFADHFENQIKAMPLFDVKNICLHEQYFYPEFKWHQNNYYEKFDTAARWCSDHGYEPMFMDEMFEFNTH